MLATFDLPLSAPASYLAAAALVPSWGSVSTFVDFLPRACSTPHFFETTQSPLDWRVEQPFFAVPPGPGGLTAYFEAATKRGVDLLRTIDRKTRAKTMFATSGIPGTVGSSACDLWRELGPTLTTDREFALWPFEGDLPTLLKSHAIVLGEIYPRAAYATALLDGPPSERPRLAVAKTKPEVRRAFMARLRQAEWARQYEVTIENVIEAEANEGRCCMVRPRNRTGVDVADDHAVTAKDCAFPSANILFSTVHPTLASRCCASNPFARRLPPRIRLNRRNVPSTRACCR